MDDIEEYDRQLTENLDEIQKYCKAAEKLSGGALDRKIDSINDLLERSQLAFRSFKVELIDVPGGQKRVFEEKLKQHKAKIDKAYQDVKFLKSSAERGQLLEGAGGGVRLDVMNDKQVLQAAEKLQDESLDSLERSKKVIADAQQIGTDTAKTLKDQTEQLNRVNADVDSIHSNLKLAEKQLKNFVRRMATDKVIMILLCLIVLAVIGLIAVETVGGGKKKDDSGDTN